MGGKLSQIWVEDKVLDIGHGSHSAHRFGRAKGLMSSSGKDLPGYGRLTMS